MDMPVLSERAIRRPSAISCPSRDRTCDSLPLILLDDKQWMTKIKKHLPLMLILFAIATKFHSSYIEIAINKLD